MTYVEFYDKTHLANICATIDNPPQKVIIVGDCLNIICSHAQRYKSILESRGFNVLFECKCVNTYDLVSIVSLISEIIEQNEDCSFDITGGSDLCLVAMGVVFERYTDKHINMHRYNIESNKLVKYDISGKKMISKRVPKLTVCENIRLYGGDIIYTNRHADAKSNPNQDADFEKDALSLWDICRQDTKAWNKQIGIFSSAETKKLRRGSGLLTEADVHLIRRSFSMTEKDLLINHELMEKLCAGGLVTSYGIDGGVFRIRYKNSMVKKCLTNPGLILEIIVYLSAKNARYKNGCHVYNDVDYSVRIDWDGDMSRRIGKYDTENEIDVIMMHGALPVFVSCKNGSFGVDELYKLHSVAGRFGREYSKKVIVATALDSMGGQANHIRQRARDMNIKLVEAVDEMNFNDLTDIVKNFWK